MITKESAKNAIAHIAVTDMMDNGHFDFSKMFGALMEAIDNIPDDGKEMLNGKWMFGLRRKFVDIENGGRQYKELGYPHRTYVNMECSVCHTITIADESIAYEFCPHCGTKMYEG